VQSTNSSYWIMPWLCMIKLRSDQSICHLSSWCICLVGLSSLTSLLCTLISNSYWFSVSLFFVFLEFTSSLRSQNSRASQIDLLTFLEKQLTKLMTSKKNSLKKKKNLIKLDKARFLKIQIDMTANKLQRLPSITSMLLTWMISSKTTEIIS